MITARAWQLKGAVPCHQIKSPKCRDFNIETTTITKVQGLPKICREHQNDPAFGMTRKR